MTEPNSAPAPSPAAPVWLRAGDALTIYTVADIADEWRLALQGAGPFAVNLATVAQCDSAGIQLLWATKRGAVGKALAFTAISGAVRKAAGAIAAEEVFATETAST